MERKRLQTRQYLFDPNTALDKALELPPILQKRSSNPLKQAQTHNAVQDKKKQLTAALPAINPGQKDQAAGAVQRKINAIKRDSVVGEGFGGETLNHRANSIMRKMKQDTEIQTETFLEPLPYPLETAAIETQTDEFLERSPSPLFIPKSSGVDVETQIQQGDLFDFETELEPLVQTIVGQCIENAWLESTQELELEKMRQRMKAFEQKRAAELTEVLRLEESERRRQEEKMRLLQEQLEKRRLKEEAEWQESVKNMAKDLVSRVEDEAFHVLQNHEYFDRKALEVMGKDWAAFVNAELDAESQIRQEARSILDKCLSRALEMF